MQQIKTHAFYENNTLQRSKELSAKRIKIQSNKSSLEEKGGGEGQGSQREEKGRKEETRKNKVICSFVKPDLSQ